jgi:antitoxin CptB
MTTGKPHQSYKPQPGIAIQAPIEGDAADKRVYWRSRRGMTELEQQLLPYVVARYPHLLPDQKALYAALLEHEDWDIFDWLQGREAPSDPAMRDLVAEIIRFGIDGANTGPA